jgi:hypothetical protein
MSERCHGEQEGRVWASARDMLVAYHLHCPQVTTALPFPGPGLSLTLILQGKGFLSPML